MEAITISRSDNRLLEKLTELWMAVLPEYFPRQRVVIGQELISFGPALWACLLHGGAFYDEPRGGNLIRLCNLRNGPVRLWRGDTVHYRVHWEGW
jgi:hypothetical protein